MQFPAHSRCAICVANTREPSSLQISGTGSYLVNGIELCVAKSTHQQHCPGWNLFVGFWQTNWLDKLVEAEWLVDGDDSRIILTNGSVDGWNWQVGVCARGFDVAVARVRLNSYDGADLSRAFVFKIFGRAKFQIYIIFTSRVIRLLVDE